MRDWRLRITGLQAGFEYLTAEGQADVPLLAQRRHAVDFQLPHQGVDIARADAVVTQAGFHAQGFKKATGTGDGLADALFLAAFVDVPDTAGVLQQLGMLAGPAGLQHGSSTANVWA